MFDNNGKPVLLPWYKNKALLIQNMKTQIFYILFLSCTLSCTMTKEKIVFTHISSNQYTQKRVQYKLKIPANFNEKILKANGEVGSCHKYYYLDSSVFYITNFGFGLNSTNIKNYNNTYIHSDYNITGVDINKKYWRALSNGVLELGYINVTKDKKKLFDTILNNFKLKD